MSPASFSQRQKRMMPIALAMTLLLLARLGAPARELHPQFYTIEDLGTFGTCAASNSNAK